jgi:hypothetical protein
MPTPPKPARPQQLDPSLLLHHDWIADPAPVWNIIERLDPAQQTKFAKTVIDSQITVLEAQVEAKRQIAKGLDAVQH